MKKMGLFLLALLSVLSVSAIGNRKQITLTFANDVANGITWVADQNTVEDNKLTFNGSWSASRWEFDDPIDVRGLMFASVERNTELTFELKDVNDNIYYVHFWGTKNLGKTEFNLSENQNTDLTQIKSIAFNPRACEGLETETAPFYATFGKIVLTIEDKTKYDEVLTIPATDASLFPLDSDDDLQKYWEGYTYDASTKTLNMSKPGCNAGWKFASQDLTSYSKIVIELEEVMGFSPQLRIYTQSSKTLPVWKNGDNGKTESQEGRSEFSINLPYDQKYIEVDLQNTEFEYLDNEDNDNIKHTTTLDRKDVNGVSFWAWVENKQIKFKSVYLVSAAREVKYLVRNNTTTEKFGTISLPFASSKPSNAKIYEVVGIDSKENPKEVYLQEISDVEAGKGYVFQSTDDQNIQFTKNGEADDLESAASSIGLSGTFSATTAPKDSYILVSGKWKKVTADNKNKVRAYRAWLVLDDALVVPEQVALARGYQVMDLGDGMVTGIYSVKVDSAEDVYYTIDGIRISSPTKKGVYVENGKKILVTQ